MMLPEDDTEEERMDWLEIDCRPARRKPEVEMPWWMTEESRTESSNNIFGPLELRADDNARPETEQAEDKLVEVPVESVPVTCAGPRLEITRPKRL